MSELFSMGGYERYVWGSVLLGVATFAWNLLAPALQRRAVMRQLADGDSDESAGDAA